MQKIKLRHESLDTVRERERERERELHFTKINKEDFNFLNKYKVKNSKIRLV